MQLAEHGNDGITLDQLSLYLLLFADDAVIFSETPEGLQKSLDNFEIYCQKWNLTVNVDKTKIIVFAKVESWHKTRAGRIITSPSK